MASLMVAEPGYGNITGLAPDARVLPIAVPLIGTDIEGTENGSVGQAVRWATDHGAKIISMSLGADRDPNRDPEPCPRDEQDAITYAVSKGVIVVAGSGNDGESGSPVAAPGVCIGVLSVGAVDSRNNVASFSSRHPYLTLTAPGVNIPTLSRIPHDAYIGAGTSQATAITSAAIALVWSKYPKATNSEIVARVLATVDHRSSGAPDPAYGYGIVNPGRAITTAVPADAANPVYDKIAPFLERAAAKAARTVTPPARVQPGDDDFGDVVVGSAPSFYDAQVIGGAALAIGGVLLLILLIVVGIVRSVLTARHGGSPSGHRSRTCRSPLVEAGLPVHRGAAVEHTRGDVVHVVHDDQHDGRRRVEHGSERGHHVGVERVRHDHSGDRVAQCADAEDEAGHAPHTTEPR
jgi:subtilisin family serine protease